MTCAKPGCTSKNPCQDCKTAIVERCLDTKEGTVALYQAARLPVPEVIADNVLGRIKQFYGAIRYEPRPEEVTMLMPVLDPWEPHPEYSGTEIRKCGAEKVLALFPEGEGSAQCWVWTLGKYAGGCADDREVARKRAEEAARAEGYQLEEDL